MAPSLRLPVFHSPYSTVSASRPNITVLIRLAPMPLMARVSSTSQNMLAGAKNRPTPPMTVKTPQYWKTFFLPKRPMIFGNERGDQQRDAHVDQGDDPDQADVASTYLA